MSEFLCDSCHTRRPTKIVTFVVVPKGYDPSEPFWACEPCAEGAIKSGAEITNIPRLKGLRR